MLKVVILLMTYLRKPVFQTKSEDLNRSEFNMVTGKNQSKTLTKHISCECKCKFDGRKCNSSQWWNNDKCWFESKKYRICEKGYIWNPATCKCKNGKYLASIIDDSVITCDAVINYKNLLTNSIQETKFGFQSQRFLVYIKLFCSV